MEFVGLFIKDLEYLEKCFDNWNKLSGIEKINIRFKIFFYKELLKKYSD